MVELVFRARLTVATNRVAALDPHFELRWRLVIVRGRSIRSNSIVVATALTTSVAAGIVADAVAQITTGPIVKSAAAAIAIFTVNGHVVGPVIEPVVGPVVKPVIRPVVGSIIRSVIESVIESVVRPVVRSAAEMRRLRPGLLVRRQLRRWSVETLPVVVLPVERGTVLRAIGLWLYLRRRRRAV